LRGTGQRPPSTATFTPVYGKSDRVTRASFAQHSAEWMAACDRAFRLAMMDNPAECPSDARDIDGADRRPFVGLPRIEHVQGKGFGSPWR
jgi:hypothetical protein